jgi:hypothetical protein
MCRVASLLLGSLVTLAMVGPVGGAAAPASAPAAAQDGTWRHCGSIYVLTTSEGADLPASAAEEGFPLLVRLHKDFFDFSQARHQGEDIRFSTSAGVALAYQVEQWDAPQGTASIWVRVPAVKGSARQEIKVRWGNPDAASESSGKAVFNESNGYLGVWHMNDPVRDEVGTVTSSDTGTTPAEGIIGSARHFAGGKGIFCGDKIAAFPSGADPHSSQAWFRTAKPNTTILGWGKEGGQGGKVRMQFRSPPHIKIDSDFSDVEGASTLPMSEWTHVVHTYKDKDSRIYVNGRLDGATTPKLKILTPVRLWIAGWYNNYDFVGDIDEVRISKVARSADWVKLEYENQKPMQTLVGVLVQPGSALSASPGKLTVLEGNRAAITATAGGAQKIYWILKRDGKDTLAAVDRFTFTLEAGRVAGDASLTVQLRAVYPDGVKTRDIPVTIKEDIPEPAVALKVPEKWDGRETIEVVAALANEGDMRAKGVGALKYTWDVSGLAVLKEVGPGKLTLKRAQNSGKLTVTLTADNGGAPVSAAATILVKEPGKDKWVHREPAKDETPENNQFYARDDTGFATLHCNGALTAAADSVFLRVYCEDKLQEQVTRELAGGKAYALSARLKPGLVKYRIEFGSRLGASETILHKAGNLVCGDAYLINGQSNAEAIDYGRAVNPYTSEWVRSYGSMAGDPAGARLKLWGNAVSYDNRGAKLQIGYWGIELAKHLVEDQKIPVFIINGAVGGTRIDMHQRKAEDPEDVKTIYGRLLWRIRQARLTHGIRGAFWHQGENDQGADGPTGGYGWETYRNYFVEMAAAWKQDYPNIQHYYVFQIWPRSCSMGVNGSDNMLREVQRTLSCDFANLSVMSTLGIKPPGPAHYPPEGYAQIAHLICPLVERDNYGKVFDRPITAADLKRAYYSSEKRDRLVLEFDQPVVWTDSLTSQFYLDGKANAVASGAAAGSVVTLTLKGTSAATKISYLDSRSWSQEKLLLGANGIAALTFSDVPILPQAPR